MELESTYLTDRATTWTSLYLIPLPGLLLRGQDHFCQLYQFTVSLCLTLDQSTPTHLTSSLLLHVLQWTWEYIACISFFDNFSQNHIILLYLGKEITIKSLFIVILHLNRLPHVLVIYFHIQILYLMLFMVWSTLVARQRKEEKLRKVSMPAAGYLRTAMTWHNT